MGAHGVKERTYRRACANTFLETRAYYIHIPFVMYNGFHFDPELGSRGANAA
jgi:hypothetical protein